MSRRSLLALIGLLACSRGDIRAQGETHWAFVPPRGSQLPAVDDPGFVRDALDRFILSNLREHGLQPAAPASRETLARRWALDLTGLPPSMGELDAFLADEGEHAAERYVDALLGSPAFGEHWARSWLDASSYADSNGYQADGDRQQWPWRDHVVRALNENQPWDVFAREAIAGDLMPEASEAQRIATAFLRNHAINNEGGSIPDEVVFHYAVDRVHTVATTFLGLTMACAQCHEHKSDPITQREYYAFQAFFDQIDEAGRIDARRSNTVHQFEISKPYVELTTPDAQAGLQAAADRFRAAADAMKPISGALAQAENAWLANIPDEELRTLPARVASAVLKQRGTPLTGPERQVVRTYFAIVASGNASWKALQGEYDASSLELARWHERVPLVMVARDRAERKPTRLHVRGAYDQPTGDALEPGIPNALGTWPEDAPRNRLGLANWLTSPSNPLFARVMVDHVWRQIFGRGLVPTAEDFGNAGQPPTHPELLDHLALRFTRTGYSLKSLVRDIVLSGTYRQSATASESALAMDPEGRLLSRSPRPRLHAFVLRDQALAVAGLLDRTCFGPPVYPYQPEGLWLDVSFEIFSYPHHRKGEQHRRTLYGFWRRTVAPPDLFDAATRQSCTVSTSVTNSPLHALTTWHATGYVEAARVLAFEVLRTSGDDGERLATMFRRATCRHPDAVETRILTHALQRERRRVAQSAVDGAPVGVVLLTTRAPEELAAWTAMAQLVLNLDEVLTRP
ncbi:MAG: DUF1549 domain-containing protein [Planctomycetes bacterium]|nr:DUF1549 domain-containing protein [Planctomycetota bacterium]MCB9890852.1 DUF1549 domain-containing protein [Planctomycetota bacterium]